MVSIGERVKTLREKRGMTQRNLASLARVTPATVSRLESGKILDLKGSALVGLADALGVSLDYLMGRVSEITPGDMVNFDPGAQEIMKAFLGLGPEDRKQLGEYTIYLEFKKTKALTDRSHVLDRSHAPDAVITFGKEAEVGEKTED